MKYMTCAVLLLMSIIRCTQPTDLSGGVFDTGNSYVASIRGKVVDPEGNPVEGAAVTARRIDFMVEPDTTLAKKAGDRSETVTDAIGIYTLDSLFPGDYNIVIKSENLIGHFAQSVYFSGGEIIAGAHSIDTPGVIIGEISAPDSLLAGKKMYVSLIGFELLTAVSNSAPFTFRLDNVPPGDHQLVVSSPSGGVTSSIIAIDGLQSGEIRSIPIDTLFERGNEDLSSWQYSKILTLKSDTLTSQLTGSDVPFPLLLRLNSTNFNFEQARDDGADIRISNMSGEILDHEIEYYDRFSKEGIFWVNISHLSDTIDTISLTLHWGNNAAPSFSSSSLTFEQSGMASYETVWHLHRVIDNAFIDATSMKYPAFTTLAIPPTEGIIVYGQYFDGQQGVLTTGDPISLGLNSFSFSLWIKLDDDSSNTEWVIMSQKESADDTDGFELRVNPQNNEGTGTIMLVGDGQHSLTGEVTWASGWHMIVFSLNDSLGSVFFDGEDVTTSGRLSLVNDLQAITIGGRNATPVFKGMLDEIRLRSRSQKSQRVLLEYENQREEATLVAF